MKVLLMGRESRIAYAKCMGVLDRECIFGH
jgi:hypothetical protein